MTYELIIAFHSLIYSDKIFSGNFSRLFLLPRFVEQNRFFDFHNLLKKFFVKVIIKKPIKGKEKSKKQLFFKQNGFVKYSREK